MICAPKFFIPSVCVLLPSIFINIRQIPFKLSSYSDPPSRWHLLPSCSLPVSFPFFLAFHFWCLSLNLMLSADRTFTKLVFSMPFNIPFLCVPSEICVSRAVVLRGEGKSDTSAYIDGTNVYMVEQKLCTCCDIFVVFCVLSTIELVKNYYCLFICCLFNDVISQNLDRQSLVWLIDDDLDKIGRGLFQCNVPKLSWMELRIRRGLHENSWITFAVQAIAI